MSGIDEPRYGFQGQEKDDEVKGSGNSYDFGARIQDPRLGRWLSIDPKFKLMPEVSPYTYGANNPLYYIDADGKVIEPSNEKSKQAYNAAVFELYDGNDVVTNLLSIASDQQNLSEISREDYVKAMSTIDNPDQRAAFNGLFLTANSEKEYNLQVISEGETAMVGTDKLSYEKLVQYDGVTISMDGFPLSTDVVATATVEGLGFADKNGAIRNQSSKIIGSLLSAFILTDVYVGNPNYSEPNSSDPELVQLQTENVVRRGLDLPKQLTGRSFKDSQMNKLTENEQRSTGETPSQIKNVRVHSSRGVEDVDVTEK